MKKNILALMCAASMVLFSACNLLNGNGGGGGKDGNGGDGTKDGELDSVWITSPKQLEDFPGDKENNDCWEYRMWCDGTVIGIEYLWGTEAFIQSLIKQSMAAEYKQWGAYHKKYLYTKVEEPTLESCEARQWEGCECFFETITWTDVNGNPQSESQYVWIPEANMLERHNYYMAKVNDVSGGTNFNHEYRKSEFEDEESCWAQNPEEQPVIPDPNPEPVDYSKFDNTTEKCWMVTQDKYTLTLTTYMWCTERTLVQTYDAMGFNYHYEPADAADEDACRELQEEWERQHETAKSCWKVDATMSAPGIETQSMTTYIWGTREEVDAIAEGLRQEQEAIFAQLQITVSVSINITPTSDADEDACYSHDQN